MHHVTQQDNPENIRTNRYAEYQLKTLIIANLANPSCLFSTFVSLYLLDPLKSHLWSSRQTTQITKPCFPKTLERNQEAMNEDPWQYSMKFGKNAYCHIDNE